jgi:hypothetical protein
LDQFDTARFVLWKVFGNTNLEHSWPLRRIISLLEYHQEISMTEDQRASAQKAKELANWKRKIKSTPINLEEINAKINKAQKIGGPDGIRF